MKRKVKDIVESNKHIAKQFTTKNYYVILCKLLTERILNWEQIRNHEVTKTSCPSPPV